MTGASVAIVCPDERLRMAVASAFDVAPPEWEVRFHPQAAVDADVVVAAGADVEGAVTFDPNHPDELIRDVQRHLARRRSCTIAVCGSSGGCGATTVALHLAAAHPGSCLVEATSTGAIALRLGLDPSMLEAAGDEVHPVPVAGGFRVVRAGEANLQPLLEQLRLRFERVIVDIDPDRVGEIIGSCDAGVLVLAPTLPSAAAAAELLAGHPDAAWAIVSNRPGPGGETTRAELQRVLGRRLTLELPCSRALRDAEGEARLVLTEWSLWLRAIRRLSKALATA